MRAPTDLPRRRGRSNARRIGLVVVASLLFFLLVSLRGIAGFYTDYLWFDELGFNSVWTQTLGTKVALGVVFTIVFFVIAWVNLFIADLLAPPFRPAGPEEQFVERYHDAVGTRGGLVRLAMAAGLALIAGPSASGQWNSWILFRNQVSFGTKDAQFGRDVGFYVFQLPFLKFVVDWLFWAVVVVLIVTAVAHYLNGGIRFQTPLQKVTPQVKAHLSVLLAVLALIKAVGYYLQRYELVFSTGGVAHGASYTDVKARLPALQLLFIISLFAVLLFLVNIMRRGWVLPVIAVGLWALVSVVVGAAYPAFIQQFRVRPNEATKERPYIERNIRATQAAYNLGGTTINDFPATVDLTADGLNENAATIRNVRLWDPEELVKTYKRLQEIRSVYQLNDVDVDRYLDPNGVEQQVLISARELRLDGIPSQSWVNQHLVYTHGYGAVLSASTGVDREGNPSFLVKDLPPTGVPAIQNPAVYFGQFLSGYAVVNTKESEVDFVRPDGTNQESQYSGTGGVEMNSVLRRTALALRFGQLNPLISDSVTSRSRAMYVRDIDERVRKAAPFLHYDSDPYPIIYKGGIHWVYDAYTTTSRYPYAQKGNTDRLDATSGLRGNFNYARNSVKVLIDAFNGTMTYYIVDPTDPIARAYQKAFPKLFTDGATMDDELRSHLRYPEDLFKVQTDMFGLYHITDPANFYNRTDAWNIAQAPSQAAPRGATPAGGATQSAGGTQSVPTGPEARMDPYYLLMRLPDEEREQFLMLQPFVPFSRDDTRKDLTAFMVAKSDPDHYGELEAFVMPRDRPIDGPALVDSRINQNIEVSEQITLLNESGSQVRLGNLLIIPVEKSLIFVRPLYVEAQGTPVPQLKKVIVVFGNRVVMRDSLRDSLTVLFGSSPPTLEEQGPAAPTPPTPPPGGIPTDPNATTTTTPAAPGGAPTVGSLLAEATGHFNAAREALGRGDLAGYQRETDAAADAVRRAEELARAGGQPPPATTVPPPPTTTVPAAPPAPTPGAEVTTTTRASA